MNEQDLISCLHPICRKARDVFLETEIRVFAPTEVARGLDLLAENMVYADTYLALTKDEYYATVREAWVRDKLDKFRK